MYVDKRDEIKTKLIHFRNFFLISFRCESVKEYISSSCISRSRGRKIIKPNAELLLPFGKRAALSFQEVCDGCWFFLPLLLQDNLS